MSSRLFEMDADEIDSVASAQSMAAENEALARVSQGNTSVAEFIAQETINSTKKMDSVKQRVAARKEKRKEEKEKRPFFNTQDWHVNTADLLKAPPIDLQATMKTIGAGIVSSSRAIYRGLRYGETVPHPDVTEKRGEEVPSTYMPPIGATGNSLSEYLNKWGNRNRFQATAGWYIREAHHDPLGADPCMMSIFLISFAARMFYEDFVDALVLAVIVTVLEFAFWVLLRGTFPVIARELDHTESVVVTLFYNIISFGMGIAVGSLALYTWPGLISVWEALEQKGCGSDGVFLLWAPCTDAQTFVTQLLLFLFILFACFRSLYVAMTTLIVLLIPVAWIAQVPYRVGNNLTFTAASSAYFLIWMAAPIKGTYVYNMFVSISFFLFVYSITALSATV